jgi:hypothetical protein
MHAFSYECTLKPATALLLWPKAVPACWYVVALFVRASAMMCTRIYTVFVREFQIYTPLYLHDLFIF